MSTIPLDDLHPDDGLIAELPDLRIEVSHHEDMVILEQGAMSGNPSRVAIHKWQVQMLAEEMGLTLVPAEPLRRDVALILARRLRKLHARLDELGKYLYEHSEDEYAQQHAWASAEVGDEYLADLDELLGVGPARSEGMRPVQAPRPVRPAGGEVRPAGRRSLGVTVQPGEDPEQAAGQAFRDFLRQNKPLLMLVAYWGDDLCGWMHRVLMEELLGVPMVSAKAGVPSSAAGKSAVTPKDGGPQLTLDA